MNEQKNSSGMGRLPDEAVSRSRVPPVIPGELETTAAPGYSARLTLICALMIAHSDAPGIWKFSLWVALLLAWLMDGVGSKPNRKPNGKERS